MPFIVTIERRNGSKSAGVVRNTLRGAYEYAGSLSYRTLCPLIRNTDDGDYNAVRIYIHEAADCRNGHDEVAGECMVDPKGKPRIVGNPIPVINGVVQINAKTVQVIA